MKATKNKDIHTWLERNTYHYSHFEDITKLIKTKKKKELTVSVGIPTLNEAPTIANVLETIQTNLVEKKKLVDELAVLDSGSTDGTVEIAKDMGIPVFSSEKILKDEGIFYGKGENLWKSIHSLKGDIIAWVDADIRNIHPRFVYGIVGPLIMRDDLNYVKSFYRRPLKEGVEVKAKGGGRVTELCVRPMFNHLFPDLTGFIQPLSGEMAGRREVFEKIPFFVGYGVETGMLIDISEMFGVDSMAQVDLDVRHHRNQTVVSLGRMSFGIMQVLLKRAHQSGKIELEQDINTFFRRPSGEKGIYVLFEKDLPEQERPPIEGVNAYHAKSTKHFIRRLKKKIFK